MDPFKRAPYPSDLLGRPSKKAAAVVLKAHRDVVKGAPLRAALSEQLRAEKSLGGQERRFVAFATRELSRHQRLLDLAARALGHPPGGWILEEDRILVRYTLWRRLFTGAGWKEAGAEVKLPGPLRPRSVLDPVLIKVADAPLPPVEDAAADVERAAIRHSFTALIAERISAQVPPSEVDEALGALNRDPDVFLRVRDEGHRDDLIETLRAFGVGCEPIPWAKAAIRVTEPGMKIFDAPALKGRRAQVQEPGSQLIAALCLPGKAIADLCAGAGGKTLALADALHGKGRVYAGDLSSRRLDEARRRVREHGLSNVTYPDVIPVEECDAVLIDAPCSGVGALGREPDQKWKLNAKKLDDFVRVQAKLLTDTAARIRMGGVLVYATCSLLREENEAQVDAFLAAHPAFVLEHAREVLGPDSEAVTTKDGYLRIWPHRTGTAGFFAARLRRRQAQA